MGGKRPPLDEERALFEATVAAEGVTTSAGEGTGLSLIDAGLKGVGANSFVSMLAVIYPGQPALVDSKDITAFDNDTGEVTVASAFKGGEVAAGVPYKIVTFRFVPAEVAAIETIVTAIQATLGALNTAAATGAVNDVKKAMAYLKELVTGLALDGSAPFSYDYTKATVPGWLHGFHMVRRILFVVPEALASGLPNTVHNVAIKAELDKLGLVETITQADALTYPDYESITLTVLGSPLAGTPWNTANLAHIKAIFGLPVVCVDATAAAYLKMGVDGVNADAKTELNAIANIGASILGAGIDDKVGLAAGANTVADAGVTFSTLDMSDEDITEIWYGWETTEDNTDVLLAEIRKTMPDATPGKDLDGADVPGTLAFYGCAYSMDGLNTLGKTVFHLLVEKLLHSSTAGLAVLLSGEVGNLAAIIGNRATPAAEGAVTTTDKAMAYIKQLVTELIVVDGLIDDIKTQTDKIPKLLPFKDQWCGPPIASLAITDTAADKDFSNVVFPTGFLPAGAIVQAIYLMVKWRKQVDSSAAPNAINGASKTIRVMKNGAVWGTNDIVGMTFADNQLATGASTTEGGDMIVGDVDVKGEVDDVDNETYNVRSEQTERTDALVVDGDALTLHDVYTGFRVYYTL
ncbi:hypothetical protein ES703_00092 [subsurface metagenome]